MFLTIAIHHPRPEYIEDFLAFMARTEIAVEGAPGLLEFRSWREAGGGRLVGLARWESQAAFQAAMPLIMSGTADRQEEWSERPDDLLMLTEP